MPIIEKLGNRGDGVYLEGGSEIYVPYTLPGEDVTIGGTGKRRHLAKVVQSSPDRVEPVCEHFGSCGGCQLQHVSADAYRKWKIGIVEDALQRAGIRQSIDAMLEYPTASRRRVSFSAARIDGELRMGFAEPGSNSIVSISQCPVLVADIQSNLPVLRELAGTLPLGKNPVHIAVVSTPDGLDVNIEGLRRPSDEFLRSLARKGTEFEFSRLSLDGEIVVEPVKPELKMGLANLVPPPGAFLQAVEAAENDMAKLVCDHMSDCKQVADLYCGAGTFALRLAENSKVWALEENPSAIEALDRAWRGTAGKLKEIRAEVRNLERQPVGFLELKRIDGVVFDPPRAGAELQVKQIAKSRVRSIAAVSCNPTTLARDLAILMEGGFEISTLTTIDQFRFTPHVEVVALLFRKTKK